MVFETCSLSFDEFKPLFRSRVRSVRVFNPPIPHQKHHSRVNAVRVTTSMYVCCLTCLLPLYSVCLIPIAVHTSVTSKTRSVSLCRNLRHGGSAGYLLKGIPNRVHCPICVSLYFTPLYTFPTCLRVSDFFLSSTPSFLLLQSVLLIARSYENGVTPTADIERRSWAPIEVS